MCLIELHICPPSCCCHNHHSNLSCRGKHGCDCSALTDMCHINMSQITFNPKPRIVTLSPSLKVLLWGLSLWYADSSADSSIILTGYDQVSMRFFLFLSDGMFCKRPNAQSIFRSSVSLSRVTQQLRMWNVKESQAQKMKACLTFFPTRRVARHDSSPPSRKLWPPATWSQRSSLFTFTSHSHRTLWSDTSWDARNTVPTSPARRFLTGKPHRNSCMAEVNHCEDQSLTAKIHLRTCEWLSEWKS